MNITGYNMPEPSYGIGKEELLRRWKDRVEACRIAGMDSSADLLEQMISEAISSSDFCEGNYRVFPPPTTPSAILWIAREREMRKTCAWNDPVARALKMHRREAQEALNLVADPAKIQNR